MINMSETRENAPCFGIAGSLKRRSAAIPPKITAAGIEIQ